MPILQPFLNMFFRPEEKHGFSKEAQRTFTPTEGRRVSLERVVVRQDQPIRLDRLVFSQWVCLGLLLAGVYELLGAREIALR